jgi:CDP-glucose 4,6-dehydratase
MAAQALVRESYINPVDTYATNIMGTVHLLEIIRTVPSVKAVVIVTSDKCYENKERLQAYRENEPMGGYNHYSSSKGCAELVTDAYRRSFFNADDAGSLPALIATARAGNVIGGGDWAEDRIIPDCMKAILENRKIIIRNPNAIRPWQHVLEPLHGYLMLAQRLYENGQSYAEPWNFGPDGQDAITVKDLVKQLCGMWKGKAEFTLSNNAGPHEAHFLKLDSTKARSRLGWKPVWNINRALQSITDWYKALSGA